MNFIIDLYSFSVNLTLKIYFLNAFNFFRLIQPLNGREVTLTRASSSSSTNLYKLFTDKNWALLYGIIGVCLIIVIAGILIVIYKCTSKKTKKKESERMIETNIDNKLTAFLISTNNKFEGN